MSVAWQPVTNNQSLFDHWSTIVRSNIQPSPRFSVPINQYSCQLYTASPVYDHSIMITFQEFRTLSPDEKNSEILKCLSLLVPLGEDFSHLKHSINSAVDKISKLEYDYGIFCPKTTTRSVDDILGSPQNSVTPNQFTSVDNIYKTSSVSSRIRSRGDLHLSGVSSFTQPLPDISGRMSVRDMATILTTSTTSWD